MVFQRYSLYPHLSVRENICFGLKARGCPRDEMDKKVTWIADILHISHLLFRRPNQLSGGEQQRVAIGRALVRNPRVYLLDEPLSNLDAKLRIEMREEIKRLHQQFTTTTIYVTHDQAEAMSLGDTLVVMNDGKIIQSGKPMDVYRNPEHIFVAGFIGNPAMNLIPGTITRNGDELVFRNDSIIISLPDSFAEGLQNRDFDNTNEFVLGIRPENILPGGDIAGEVIVVEPLGAETLLLVRFGAHELRLRITKPPVPDAGSTIGCTFAAEHLHLFHEKSGLSVASQF
jgi:multiple sugar transport system ATP-binding protein